MEGQGTYTYANGSKYIGEYKDNKRHGEGVYTYSDGGKFVGEWKLSVPWSGVLYDASNSFKNSYKDGVPSTP